MTNRVLGLDLGANSLGWALLEFDDDQPKQIIASGVRIFEAGMEGEFEQGKEESRGIQRREARQARKQIDRRARRQRKLEHILQKSKLLPEGSLDTGQNRHNFLTQLDAQLHEQYKQAFAQYFSDASAFAHVFPYWLRAHALDHKLTPFALGRALYHLGQRRGFLSNRKARKKNEDTGIVKSSIEGLRNDITAAHSRSLGEHFMRFNPHTPQGQRIRQRWTHRQMFLDEFDAIWEAQAKHHPQLLTGSIRNAVHEAMFFQRPLKSQKELIGRCELEQEQRRAPWALLDAQRFRLLQKVNDLEIIDPEFNRYPLSPEQRAQLAQALEAEGDMSFSRIRIVLGLPKKGYRFNFEAGGEKRLPGNRTSQTLREIFGSRWDAYSREEQQRILDDILSFEKEDALVRRGINHYKLDTFSAEKLGACEFEQGYCSLSRRALAKVLPFMEQGERYITARDKAYQKDYETGQILIPDLLPPLHQAPIPEMRNPAVTRALTELCKVVNAVIRAHGKPDKIRVELARDLKRNKKDRNRIWKKNRENQAGREKAAERIIREAGIPNPRRGDIERVLLAQECNWECPYTGKHISMSALLGEHAQFDIEHIVPFSRSLDDSFMNKTLCYNEENRHIKKNRTPFEAYGADPEKWNQLLERVKGFNSSAAEAKLERFKRQTIEELDQFSDRQLNDTRYASTLAAKYLAVLYGPDYRKHIQVSAGQVTAQLRSAWGLNAILGDGGEKSRDDHRHHTIDAIAIALTSPAMVRNISRAAQQAEKKGNHRWWKGMPLPWETFLTDVENSTRNIIVSHRVSRKVNGPLHEETNYSPPKVDEKGTPYVHVRKAIEALSAEEINNIVDPIVRQCVQKALASLGISDPKKKKAFATPSTHPRLPSGLPIHRVRIRKNLTPFQVGQDERARFVTSKSNHHMEIIEVTDKKGRTKWEGIAITQYEAMKRLHLGLPVVQKEHGENMLFIFSLAVKDCVYIENHETLPQGYYLVRSIWGDGRIVITKIDDARKEADIRKSKEIKFLSTNSLKSFCKKVTITPLGEIRNAND